jgi:CHAT domain-containing protein
LKLGEGAIEFIHFHYHHPDLTDSVFYAALVVRPDRPQPVFISLFEKSAIDKVLHPEGARRSDYVNGLYAYADRGLVDQAEPAPSLYDLIWKPLEEHPDGVHDLKTIYYSLTGLLHRLNLGAIAIDDERSLADQYQLVQLGSTRKLVQQKLADQTVNNGVLFGGIRYDLDSTEVLAALALDDPSLLASRGDQSMANMDQSIKSGAWSYLKWTERESQTIGTTLEEKGISIQQFSDIEGTEEAFKALGAGTKSSPGIIHMATHGYFFPDPEEIHQENSSEIIFQLSANPMIRSGLILAGGNYVWSGAKPFTGREDGILTAYEISQMDLTNTELVVLSACETGLGDIKGNEGVYGLQRAFKIAGVKYLIMSLWQVPDRETMQFMTTFYGHWLADKLAIPEAFQLTQREMRDRFYNPYSWAGFVLVE